MISTTLAGQATTRIGLGCGRLVGAAGAKASRGVVEAALELGIRHFDTAPSYGLGTADNVLGEVLAEMDGVTIVTKVGQMRPRRPALKAFARRVLRPMLATSPSIRARLARAAGPGDVTMFARADIEASLDDSLKRLRVAAVTGVLLHEIASSSLTDILDTTLQAVLASGRTLALGSGTAGAARDLVRYGTIGQYRWTPEEQDAQFGDAIIHGALRYFKRPTTLSTWQQWGLAEMGRDPADPNSWPGLVLTLALASRPRAILLVSATRPERLRQGMAAIDWRAASGFTPETLKHMRAVLYDQPLD